MQPRFVHLYTFESRIETKLQSPKTTGFADICSHSQRHEELVPATFRNLFKQTRKKRTARSIHLNEPSSNSTVQLLPRSWALPCERSCVNCVKRCHIVDCVRALNVFDVSWIWGIASPSLISSAENNTGLRRETLGTAGCAHHLLVLVRCAMCTTDDITSHSCTPRCASQQNETPFMGKRIHLQKVQHLVSDCPTRITWPPSVLHLEPSWGLWCCVQPVVANKVATIWQYFHRWSRCSADMYVFETFHSGSRINNGKQWHMHMLHALLNRAKGEPLLSRIWVRNIFPNLSESLQYPLWILLILASSCL